MWKLVIEIKRKFTFSKIISSFAYFCKYIDVNFIGYHLNVPKTNPCTEPVTILIECR